MNTFAPLSPVRLALSGSVVLAASLTGIASWHAASQTRLPLSTLAIATPSLLKPQVADTTLTKQAGQQSPTASKKMEADAGKYKIVLEKIVRIDKGPGSSREIVSNGYHFNPNLIVNLKVTATEPSDLKLLTGFSPQAVALDSNGIEAEKSPLADGDRDRTGLSGSSGVLLLRLKDPNVTRLRSLEGTLFLEEGKLDTLELSANDFKAGVEKQFGPLKLKVNSFQIEGNSVQADLSLSLPMPLVNAPTPNLYLQRIAEIMGQNARTLKVEMRDGKGEVYAPTHLGAFYVPPSLPKPVDTPSIVPQPEEKPAIPSQAGYIVESIRVTLPVLAEAPTPKTLVLKVITHTGVIQRIPFKFTEIPLPELP